MTPAEQVYRAVGLAELKTVAQDIAHLSRDYTVWCFSGEMGAGKTTLIKAVCQALGVTDAMSSPTFAIVNEYAAGRDRVFHFDFYRIRSEREALDIGVDEYFYSGYPCFVEWSEKIPSLIPARHGVVSISADNETERTIAITLHDGQEENRV